MKHRCRSLLIAFLGLGMLASLNFFQLEANASPADTEVTPDDADGTQDDVDGKPDDADEKPDDAGGKPKKVIKKKGEYYAVQKDGTVYSPQKEGIKKIGKYKYYVYKDGKLATGLVKIKKNKYYFNKKARLQANIRPVEIEGRYYNVDKKGIAIKISEKQAQTELAAQKFINKHTKKSMSRKEKFRACFNYLLAYMRYSPGYYKMKADYKIIDKKDGGYILALQTFQSPVLRGNCHRFANCVAAIAKELGYDPTVIVTKGDHSFVVIDGKYYDNMGALFGASSRSSYSVYKKIRYS